MEDVGQALHDAIAACNHASITELLEKHSSAAAFLSSPDVSGFTPLMRLIATCKLNDALKLMDYGDVAVNAKVRARALRMLFSKRALELSKYLFFCRITFPDACWADGSAHVGAWYCRRIWTAPRSARRRCPHHHAARPGVSDHCLILGPSLAMVWGVVV
jgi:hypothetical protein